MSAKITNSFSPVHEPVNYKRKLSILDSINQRINNENMSMGEKFQLSFLFNTYAENSSISGLPQLSRSKEILRILFWIIIVLGGLGCLIWQINEAVTKYLQHEMNTKISSIMQSSMDFPAVTICNQNPVDFRKAKLYTPTLYDYLNKIKPPDPNSSDKKEKNDSTNTSPTLQSTTKLTLQSITNSTTQSITKSASTTRNSSTSQYTTSSTSQYAASSTYQSSSYPKKKDKYGPDVNEYSDRDIDTDYDYRLNVQAMTADLPRRMKKKIGTDLEDFMLTCTYNNYKCDHSDFRPVFNQLYGNCFMFNVLDGKNTLKTMDVGPEYGLKMMLFVNSSTYIPTTENVGARIVVHHPTVYPFPEDVGLNARPGSLTSIGISATTTETLYPPEGKCHNYTTTEAKQLDAYMELVPNVTYSKPGCLKTCFQKLILHHCNCFNPNIPFKVNFTAYNSYSSSQKYKKCNLLLTHDDYSCIKHVSMGLNNETLKCEKCVIKCMHTFYHPTISQCNWPSKYYENKIMWLLGENEKMAKQNKPFSEIISNELLKVEIYFDSLKLKYIKDEDAYTIYMLIADIGGQMGLWLGLSMAAIFELVELIFDIFTGLIKAIGILRARAKVRQKWESKKSKKLPDVSTIEYGGLVKNNQLSNGKSEYERI